MIIIPGVCKKSLLLFVFLLHATIFPVALQGQFSRDNYNFREFQAKAYYFGLTFGYNHSDFQLLPSKKFILNDSFKIAEGLGGPGLNVSLVANMKLGEYFDFRFLPGFSFVGRKIYYLSAYNDVEQVHPVESVLLQLPLQFRFKSDPFNDTRVFVLVGAKYTYDGASTAGIREEQARHFLRLSPHDFSVEAGAGFQVFFPLFILSPEIKYSHGIGNILIYNRDLSRSVILEKIISRALTISLNFEG